MNLPLLSIIIPCYNEEESVEYIYGKIASALSEQVDSYEIIYVDDGSKDRTIDRIRTLSVSYSNIHYVSFSRNFGKEAAILAGLESAQGEYIAIMDADGQDPPALLPEMLKAVQSGDYHCAGTRRVNRQGEPPIRSFFARRFYSIIRKLSNINIVDGARDFRLMNRPYLNAILAMTERNRFSKGIFPWVGFRTKWFEYENIPRHAGTTKWSFWKLFLYSIDGILTFSTKPLAIASVLGIFLFLTALLFIAFIVIRYFIYGDPVDGWASTVCIILFCSGVQLFSIGIIGQYLAKMYTEVKGRPHYIVQEAG